MGVLLGTDKESVSFFKYVWLIFILNVFPIFSVPIALDALYIRKYGSEETNEEVTDMVKRVRQQLRTSMLEEVQWMDPRTKRRAVRKLDSITAVVGAPKELLDNNALNRLYAGLEISCGDSFLCSSMELLRFRQLQVLRKLRVPLKSTYEWQMTAEATSVGPQFFYTENVIS